MDELVELFRVGEPSPVFNFFKQEDSEYLSTQINMISANVLCIGLQGCFLPKELNSFRDDFISFDFCEIDDVFEIVYEFGTIYGDIAFNVQNRYNQITKEDIMNSSTITIMFFLVDLNGNSIAIRYIEISENVSKQIIESFIRLDKISYDTISFEKRTLRLFENLSVDEIKKDSFVKYVSYPHVV